MPKSPFENAEHWLRVFADSTPAYMAYVSADDLVYRYVNHAFEVGFGRPREEIVGRHIIDVIGQANYDFALPFIDRVRAGESVSYENTFHLQQGRRWSRVNYQPDVGPDGKVVGIFVLTYDITDRRLAEEQVRQEKDFAERLIDTAQVLVVLVDPQGRVVRWNRAMEETTGYTRAEVLGTPAAPWLYPESELERLEALLQRVLAEGTSQVFRGQITTRTGEKRTVEWRTRVLRANDGQITYLLGTGQDLTDALRAEEERQRLEHALLQTQKLEAIGKLAGGVAHDMNNNLAVVTGFASVLRRRIGDDPALRESVEGIIDAANRGAELTRNLLGFARKGNYRKEPVDLNAVVARAFAMLSRTLAREITLTDHLLPGLPLLEGDPGQLHQVLVNLILNAVDATSGRGTVTVSTDTLDAAEAARLRLQPRPHVRVTVADTGAGMDAATAARAFEPFFTTKPPGSGTGLGLSMVYGTIHSHGGQVLLDSTPGQGTTITLLLPALEGADTEAFASRPSPVPFQPGSGTVLLVDDEPLVRASTARMLESIGYGVVTAAGGQEALVRFEAEPARYRAVVLDLVMPSMNGEETFERLRAVGPKVPVLLATGHAREHATVKLMGSEHVALLQKPFELEALSEALGRLLKATAPPRS